MRRAGTSLARVASSRQQSPPAAQIPDGDPLPDAAPLDRAHLDDTVRTTLRSPRLLRREVMAGLVVALALIPEAISFSLIAGVDPRVGLFASFTMAVSIAFLGGRPAMISAATGAIALVIAPVAREYGTDYFIATVILAGIFQVLLGAAGVARMMRFVPRSVMVGFVNALAILIFLAQVPHMRDVPWMVYPMIAAGIAIMVALPRVSNAVPAPLVAIVALTALALAMGLSLPDVGDEGELPRSLPTLFFPDVPLNLETFRIIAPFALAMALVGLLESLLTAKLVDDITDTHSHKTREAWGQGAANVITGFFGGMGGCAMIGQTMINVKASGARTRISTFCAGLFLLVLVVGFGDVVALIPMAALVAVMIMVAVGTFDWHSVAPATLRRMPKSETTVMLSTVAVTVTTHNLAYGVVVGVLVAMTLFARRVAHLANLDRELVEDTEGHVHARYTVTGELFFASSNDLYSQFEYAEDPQRVVIDLTHSHVWDASTVAALDSITTKYERKGKTVEIHGLNEASTHIHNRLSGQLASH
jgi:SulP family sulfate permease